jgi:hypothetical protein
MESLKPPFRHRYANAHYLPCISAPEWGSDLDLSTMKVQVQFNSNTSFSQKLAVGNHELLVHAEDDGELIKKFQEGKLSLQDFQKEIKVRQAGYQHDKMTNGFNDKYNQANLELVNVIKNSPSLGNGLGVEYHGPNNYQGQYSDNSGEMTLTMNKAGYITLLQGVKNEFGPAEKSWFYRTQENTPPLQIFKSKEDMEKFFDLIRKSAPTPAK